MAEGGVDTEAVEVEQEARGTEAELLVAAVVVERYVTVKKRSCCVEMPRENCCSFRTRTAADAVEVAAVAVVGGKGVRRGLEEAVVSGADSRKTRSR